MMCQNIFVANKLALLLSQEPNQFTLSIALAERLCFVTDALAWLKLLLLLVWGISILMIFKLRADLNLETRQSQNGLFQCCAICPLSDQIKNLLLCSWLSTRFEKTGMQPRSTWITETVEDQRICQDSLIFNLTT